MQAASHDRDMKLRLGCSIFLSHSGADKEYVRFLNEALLSRGYNVFYDEESLPKAMRVSMRNILAELKDTKLAIVVLSDAFFTRTQHPMSEVATMVAANIQILPIFYEFSVDQFKAECPRKAWLTEWERWADQGMISEDTIKDWVDALKVVSGTNGLEFCKEATNTLKFRDEIVARVCQILKPDISWRNEGFQGMDRLCQIVSERFEDLRRQMMPFNGTMVVGMHGISGIGKSSFSKALCDFFFKEFNSRVCYIELRDHSEAAVQARLERVHSWLIGGMAPSRSLSVEQLWNHLKDCIRHRAKWPVFLAIDNVQNDRASMEEANEYLNCGPYPKGSKIFLTAQSANVLSSLTSRVCVESFPRLNLTEARNIFLHLLYLRGHNTLSQQEENVVDECVRMCTLNKSKGDYYPLMVVLLASYMLQSPDLLQGRGRLKKLKRDGIFASTSPDIQYNLGQLFKRIYVSLTEHQRHMLIDLALYLPDALNLCPTTEPAKTRWLKPTHPSLDVDQILSQLADLSLVESRDLSVIHTEKCFHVHDLLRDFVVKEASESSACIFLENKRVEPLWRGFRNRLHIERLGISNCRFEDPVLDLSDIEKVEVLHLIGNQGLTYVRLSRTAWNSLQSLVVQSFGEMTIRVSGAADKKPQAFYLQLANCGFISWPRSSAHFRQSISNSSYLLYLNLCKVQMFKQLGACFKALRQLQFLKLADLPDLRINLSLDRCPHIREISLSNLPHLEAISGLENSSNLVSLLITKCNTLRSLVILDKCASYGVYECKALESIEVQQSQPTHSYDEVTEGSLSAFGCPLVHIIGLSQRRYIRTVSYDAGTCEKSLECTPERLQHLFENCGNSLQRQIRTATIMQFKLKLDGLQELKLRDAQDLSSYISALNCTSASSLVDLKIICSRHGDCGCHCGAHWPRFDYFKMALKVLCYSCTSVSDLSSIENCNSMELLCLYGCLSAVKWPDFGKMTSLETLIVDSPGSLAYWPSGLQSHPCLDDIIINGSNQIPPEELLKAVTSMDPESRSRLDRLSPFAALEVLVDNTYSCRKPDNLCIAEALMSNSEKLLFIIDKMLSATCLVGDEALGEVDVPAVESDDVFHEFKPRKQLQVTNMKFFHLLSQLLYGLWVEADCNLHECSLTCGTEDSQMQRVQACLQRLLSSTTMISALLLTIPEGKELWYNPRRYHGISSNMVPICLPCKGFRSCYAYESLVLVSFASMEKFKVQLEAKLVSEIKDIVRSFFESWKLNDNGRLPLLLWDVASERFKEAGDDFYRLIEHELSAVRVAEAVLRLGQLTGIRKRRRIPKGARFALFSSLERPRIQYKLDVSALDARYDYKAMALGARPSVRRLNMNDELARRISETYCKYKDIRARSRRVAHQDSQAIRKRWHHPVGCFCQLRRREDYSIEQYVGADYIPPDYSVFSSDLRHQANWTSNSQGLG